MSNAPKVDLRNGCAPQGWEEIMRLVDTLIEIARDPQSPPRSRQQAADAESDVRERLLRALRAVVSGTPRAEEGKEGHAMSEHDHYDGYSCTVCTAEARALRSALASAHSEVEAIRKERDEAFAFCADPGPVAVRERHRAEAAEATVEQLRERVEVLTLVLAAVAFERCPACPGREQRGNNQGHDDRCWYGTILAGEPGPAYDAACAAVRDGSIHRTLHGDGK